MRLCGGRVRTRVGDGVNPEVGSWERSWEMPSVEVFDLVAYQFQSKRLVFKGQTMLKLGFEGPGGEMHAFVRRRVPLRIECGKVLSQVFSTGLHGSVNWPQCVGRVTTAKMETDILRMILRPLNAGEGSVQFRKRIPEKMRTTWRKKTVAKMAFGKFGKCVEDCFGQPTRVMSQS